MKNKSKKINDLVLEDDEDSLELIFNSLNINFKFYDDYFPHIADNPTSEDLVVGQMFISCLPGFTYAIYKKDLEMFYEIWNFMYNMGLKYTKNPIFLTETDPVVEAVDVVITNGEDLLINEKDKQCTLPKKPILNNMKHNFNLLLRISESIKILA